MDFISRWNENSPIVRLKMSVMQILLAAFARAVARRPALNRFVSNFRHYQRNNISISFVTRKNLTDDGNKSDDDVDLFEKLPVFVLRFAIRLLKFLDRYNWIPKSMIRLLPFYSSAFPTNVGSLKLDAPFHHNFETGNCGIFISPGKLRFEKFIDKDNMIRDRRVVSIRYTFDDRIVDGIYSGRAMKLIEKPDIDPKYIKEPALTEKGWNLWAKSLSDLTIQE